MTSLCGQAQDMKVCCETLAVGGGGGDEVEPPAPETTIIQPPKNEDEDEYAYAPESFWVSKEAELDWLDRNAYLERKDSGKAGNPATSQRYSGGANIKSKTTLIGGLPNYKPQSQKHNCGHRKHGHGVSVRLFPNKRSEPKPSLSMTEPGSPKVSCMGRVKSRSRSRNRSGSGVHVKPRKSGFGFGFGFWKKLFRSKGPPSGINNNDNHCKNDFVPSASSSTTTSSNHKRPLPYSDCHPSLGGMKRFGSGRKSDAWAAHVEVDGAKSEPLDLPAAAPIWRRRDVRPPLDVHVDVQRDWRNLGPVSV